MPFTFEEYRLGSPKPWYKCNPLLFESELDCAAYILQDWGKSRRHDDILRAVRRHTGMTELELVTFGNAVKERIANLVESAAPGECVYVPATEISHLGD
jgi:hypothetical protein